MRNQIRDRVFGRRPFVVLGLLLGIATILLACSGSGTQEQDTVVPEATEGEGHQEEALSDPALRGLDVFTTAGCLGCHGQSAEGTAIAPALAGHTESQVLRQVRAPVGIMPLFPSDKITNAQMDDLVAYIASLGEGHAHEMSAGVGAEMEMHHWMALFAIEDGALEEGRHHIQHIIELPEGTHQARMRDVLAALETGDIHDAAHEIEEMLAGVLADDLAEATLHLRLALSSVRIDDGEGAAHHLSHFAAMTEGAAHEAGEVIMALV